MTYSKDMTTIPMEDRIALEKAAEELGYEPLLISRMSNHPDDNKLFVVLGFRIEEPQYNLNRYAVWGANTFHDGSLFNGHYALTLRQALKVASEKIHDFNEEE